MPKRLRPQITFANVVSCLALFVALGGASYAATQLPKNSVGTKQLKTNAVTGAKVKNGSLTTEDFGQSQLSAGPVGKEGPPGPKGDPGAAGVASVVTRYGPERELPNGAGSFSYAACEPGEVVTGGGFDFVGSAPVNFEYVLTANRPSLVEEGEFPTYPTPPDGGGATGWLVGFENESASTFNFRAYVQCASP